MQREYLIFKFIFHFFYIKLILKIHIFTFFFIKNIFFTFYKEKIFNFLLLLH